MPTSAVAAYLGAMHDFEAAHIRFIETIAAAKSDRAITAAMEARREALDRVHKTWDALSEVERAGLVLPLRD